MPIVVVGLNHRTAPIDVLERLSIPDELLPKALHQLLSYDHVVEGAVLSTCNRIEAWAVVSRFHGGALDLRNFLSELCYVAPEDFVDHVYTYHDEGAVRHVFRVAAGVDSMIVGESEILGQVRRAYQVAVQEGSVQRVLGHVLRQALSVGRRVRSETGIARHPLSVSSAAVELARRTDPGGSLRDKRVLVVGAGKMGALALQALAHAGARNVTVVSRTEERARSVAASKGVAACSLDDLGPALCDADIVICSTTSPHTVLDRAAVGTAVARRDRSGPLVIVDIAVPRDVDPSVADIDGVVLRDIDDLRGVVDATMGGRIGEVSKVHDIIAGEVQRHLEWERADAVGPTVGRLVSRGEHVRRAELARARARLEGLSSEQQQAVDQLTRRIVAKLLHPPLRGARKLAGSNQGHLYLQVMRELFELDDDVST